MAVSFSSLSNISVAIQEQLVHCELSDGECRKHWLDKEPAEGDLSVYNCQQDMAVMLADPGISSRTDSLLRVLTSAVECRVRRQPGGCRQCVRPCHHCSVAVCFSGGLDSTVIALLVDRFTPLDSPIDLYNVAFRQESGGFDVPDRITGVSSLEELKKLAPHRIWNFIKVHYFYIIIILCSYYIYNFDQNK